MIRVAAFTGGLAVASARFRVRQLIGPLRSAGIDVVENYPSLNAYPPPIHNGLKHVIRPLWALASLSQRIAALARSHLCQLTFLQREFISTRVSLEPFTRSPRIFDVDDAIWETAGTAAGRLARMCDLVICGNSFLAEYFSRWNSRVEILPSAVDVHRFHPAEAPPGGRRFVVGWSGASASFPYLYQIEPVLASVLKKHPGSRLRVLSDRQPQMSHIPTEQVEFIPWSEETEVAALQGMHVGLMPLPDSTNARGKCSYKMLLYMACSVPVVVSPVGMNREVLSLGDVGLAPESLSEWGKAVDGILSDSEAAEEMGRKGRQVVVSHFSVEQIAPRLAKLVRQVVDSKLS